MQSTVHAALEQLDIELMQKLWAHVFPHLYQAQSREELFVMMHAARTELADMPLKARAYSHRWLLDNGYRSMLPDDLKPQAERMYPKVVDAVGLSVNFRSELRPLGERVRMAMEYSILECYADGDKDPKLVKARMMEVKAKTIKQLIG